MQQAPKSPLAARANLSARSRLAIASIAILAATLSLFRLGAVGADVCGGNEAVEGVFLQQMVEHGQRLFPLENGREPLYKPPLFHWTALAIDRLAGIDKVTAFNLRLPSAIFATAGVILTMLFAFSQISLDAGLLSGMILTASYQYISQGRIGRVDMTLTFLEALALFSFLWWLSSLGGSREKGGPHATALRYLFALALGLGVLAKGPVGALLPLLAVAIFLAAGRRWEEARRLFSAGSALLAAAVGSSWYAACLFANRYGLLDKQLGLENFGRFFGTLGRMPFSYYLTPLLLNSVPLSLLVPFAVYAALAQRALTGAQAESPPQARADDAARLLAIFWLVTLLFFWLSAYKRRAYLLPLWPPAAVLIAWWMERLAIGRRGRIFRGAVAGICGVLVFFNLIYIPFKEFRDCAGSSFRQAAMQINRAVGADEPLYLYGVEGEPAPLLFYLDRDAPPLTGKLGNAPPGYVIVPQKVWVAQAGEALGLEPVLTAGHGPNALVLVRRGRSYAGGSWSAGAAARASPRALSSSASAVRSRSS